MRLLIMEVPPSPCYFRSWVQTFSSELHAQSPSILCSSLNVRGQISHPWRTTGRINFV